MAISNILYGSFLENPFLKFLFIVFVFYLLSRIVQLVILGNIRRLTKKTKTKLDDLVIDAIKKPLLRFLALIGVKIAVNVLPLSEKVLSIFHQILNSLLMFVVVLLMVKLMDIIINVWGKNWAKKTESSLDDDILPLLHKTSHIVLMTAGVFFILGEWNIDLTGLLAGVGIAGLAIGFAVKDSLANIFGGISIILDKALKVNDVIKLENGSTGTIVDIGLRSTKIRTWNNELLIIPNGTLANSTIQNYKKPDLSVRTEVSFEVDLLKFGLSGESINAQVIYNIFDVEGNLIHSETENVGVETQMNFIKTLTLSEELIEGKYSVKIEVLYDGKTAESMMSFEVVEELLKEKSYFVYYLLLSVLLIIGMIIVLRKRLIFGKQLERKNHFEDSFTNVEQKSVSWIKPIVNDKITLSLKILILKLLDFIELVILVVISVYKKIKIKIEEEKEFLKKSFRGDLWK